MLAEIKTEAVPVGPIDFHWLIKPEDKEKYEARGLLIMHMDDAYHLVIRQVIFKMSFTEETLESFDVGDISEWLHPVVDGVISVRTIYSAHSDLGAI